MHEHTSEMETLIFMIQLKSFIINLVSSIVHFHQERNNVVDFVQTSLQTVTSKYPSSQEPHNPDTIVTFVCPIVELSVKTQGQSSTFSCLETEHFQIRSRTISI